MNIFFSKNFLVATSTAFEVLSVIHRVGMHVSLLRMVLDLLDTSTLTGLTPTLPFGGAAGWEPELSEMLL